MEAQRGWVICLWLVNMRLRLEPTVTANKPDVFKPLCYASSFAFFLIEIPAVVFGSYR